MSDAQAGRGFEAAPLRLGGFLVNVNLVFVGTLLGYGLAFATAVLLARTLGPDGRGVVALYQSAVGLGYAFFSLGIGAAGVYFVARREVQSRQALEAGVSVSLGAAAVTAVAVGVLAVALGHWTERGVPFWLALLALPAAVQFGAVSGVLRGQGRFGAMNLLELSLPLTILVCLALLEGLDGLTVRRAVFAWSLSYFASIALGYALIGRGHWPRCPAGLGRLTPLALFGVKSQLSNLIQLLNYRLDAYLVLLFVDTKGVGLYSVSVSLSEGMWFVANSVAVVLLTDLTAGDESHARRLTGVVCRSTLLITALASLAAAAVSPLVIPPVFGGDFRGSVLPFILLLPGSVALAGAKVLSAYVFSRGLPLVNARIALATLVITVAADLVLIPLFGVAGAAAAASLAYAVSLTLTALAYRRLSGDAALSALLPQKSDLGLYAGVLRSLAGR